MKKGGGLRKVVHRGLLSPKVRKMRNVGEEGTT